MLWITKMFIQHFSHIYYRRTLLQMSWKRGPPVPSEIVPLSPLPVPLSLVPVPEHLLFLWLSGISVELTYKYILTPKIAFQIWCEGSIDCRRQKVK